jgi:hypothetical protein
VTDEEMAREGLTFDFSPGECRVCGCTEEESCPGGCIWANSEATLCSRCAREEG